MKLAAFLEAMSTVSGSHDGRHWHPVRPQIAENTFLRYRLRMAWLVLTGKADAVEWAAAQIGNAKPADAGGNTHGKEGA